MALRVSDQPLSTFQNSITGDEKLEEPNNPKPLKKIVSDVPDLSIISEKNTEVNLVSHSSPLPNNNLRDVEFQTHYFNSNRKLHYNKTNYVPCQTNCMYVEHGESSHFCDTGRRYKNDYKLNSPNFMPITCQCSAVKNLLSEDCPQVRSEHNEGKISLPLALNQGCIEESCNIYHSDKYLQFKKQKETAEFCNNLPIEINTSKGIYLPKSRSEAIKSISTKLKPCSLLGLTNQDEDLSLNEHENLIPVSQSLRHNSTSDSDSSLVKSSDGGKSKRADHNFPKNVTKKKCTKKNCKKCLKLREKKKELVQHNSSKLNLEPVNAENSFLHLEINNIWDHLKDQDKKLNAIQEQVSAFLSEKSCCCDCKPLPALQSTESNAPVLQVAQTVSNGDESEKKTENAELLGYLKTQGEQMQKLQEQMNLLLLKSVSQSEFPKLPTYSDCDPVLNAVNVDTCLQAGPDSQAQVEHIQSTKNPPTNVVCQESKQVTQTSTSTMTSLTCEGSDKLVYRKMLTVVTDVSKVSAQYMSSQEWNGRQTSKEGYLSTPVKDKTSKKKLINKKTKHQKPEKHLIAETTPSEKERARKEASPEVHVLHESCRNELHDLDGGRKNLPRYESILRNVNELVVVNNLKMDKNEQRYPETGIKKKNVLKSSTPICIENSADISSKTRNKKRAEKQSSDSNTESPFHSPGRHEPKTVGSNDAFQESSTISRYGLSSPNLSVATKQYLENYGLVCNGNDKTKTALKVRKSLTKRYPS